MALCHEGHEYASPREEALLRRISISGISLFSLIKLLWIGSYPFVFFCLLLFFVVGGIFQATGDSRVFSETFTLSGLAAMFATIVLWPLMFGIFFGTVLKIGLTTFLRIRKTLEIEVVVVGG
jgi:hypothetical protein